jgi:hypothetical protein
VELLQPPSLFHLFQLRLLAFAHVLAVKVEALVGEPRVLTLVLFEEPVNG